MFQSIPPLILLEEGEGQQVLPPQQWQVAMEDSMVLAVVVVGGVAGSRLAKVEMARKALL
jgi:hypothetical protein